MTTLRLLATTTAAASIAGVAAAQTDGPTDADFGPGFEPTGYYEAIDVDDDGSLSRDEFVTSTFAEYDRDNDMALTEDEYAQGMSRSMGQDMSGDAGTNFGSYDTDASGSLDPSEFGQSFGDDLWARWDTDSDDQISVQEYRQGAYDTADTDMDATLTDQEVEDYASWFEDPVELGSELSNIGDAAYSAE